MPTRASSPPSKPSPGSLLGRLAVTLLAPIALMLASAFGPAMVDTSALPRTAPLSTNVSVFALGIMPFLSASVLVEIVAAIVPRWAKLRHGGPRGRGKLWRATLGLALVLCFFQAFSVARMLSFLANEHALGMIAMPMVVLSLTAGAFLLCFLAQLAGGYGLAGGFATLMIVTPVVDQVVSVAQRLVPEAPGKPLAPLELVAIALVSASVVGATWYALRQRSAPAEAKEAPSPEILTPASGIIPLLVTSSLLTLPATLSALRVPLGAAVVKALDNNTTFRVVALLLLTVLGVWFSYAFNDPARIAALRAAGPSAKDLEAAARDELRPAIARSLLFLVLLFALGEAARRWISATVHPASLALATALAMDIAAEFRARRAMPSLVAVWPEHRPYALAAARDALDAAGIPVHARGERVRRLLQFFGPMVPIELLVRREDAKQATKILADVLLFKTAEERIVAEFAGEIPPRAQALRPPSAVVETRAAAALTLIAAALVLFIPGTRPSPPRMPHASPEALEIVLVDDENDPFETSEPLPRGLSLQIENVPLGPGRTLPRHYARLLPSEGETMEQARLRLVAWAERVTLPAGDRVAVARVTEYDDEKDRVEVIGWRTYLVKGSPAVTGVDVVDAIAVPEVARDRPGGAYVSVTLGDAGAQRFAAVTRENVKRRLAIVVEGVVESAPQILSEIQGGHVQITMGQGDPEAQLADAKRLEQVLRGE